MLFGQMFLELLIQNYIIVLGDSVNLHLVINILKSFATFEGCAFQITTVIFTKYVHIVVELSISTPSLKY